MKRLVFSRRSWQINPDVRENESSKRCLRCYVSRLCVSKVVSEFVVVSSLWLEIGAERRLYNIQIRTLLSAKC